MRMRMRAGTVWIAGAAFGMVATACMAQTATPQRHYVGSESCRKCHESVYGSWKKTRMANVVRDPAQHPEAVLGDFSQPNPVVTFSLKDVAFVYGSRWKQRYFTKIGDDFYAEPAQWAATA